MKQACPDEELLAAFVDHSLSGAETERVERHMDGCPGCRSVIAELLRADEPSDPGDHDESFLESLASPKRNGNVLLSPGEKVGRFIVLDRLGLGGMGVVYLAHDPQLDRKVALKLLRADVARGAPGEEARQRLLREAKAMARLSHPNVIGVHDVGTFGDEIFLAFEFVDGVTLRAWKKQKPRSWREVLNVYLQAGRGLAAAHEAGLIHRDFKPENALAGKDGRVRVTDFGLVRAISQNLWPNLTPLPVPVGVNLPLESALTRANALMGTPAYMAPEQLLGRPADERSDQFSFCVALFEALYGNRPYPGNTIEQLRAQFKKARPLFPVKTRVPLRIRWALAKGLQPQPTERYPSMELLLKDLLRARTLVERRWIATGLGTTAAVAGAAVFALWPTGSRLCSGGELRLRGVWDEDRKEAVRKALIDSGRGDGELLYPRVEAELDRWAKSFSDAHREACEATRVRGEVSEQVLDARMFCLEGRLKEGKALVDVLSRPGAAERAPEATARLSPMTACADVNALAQGVPPPDDARVRAQVEALRGELAMVKAQRAAGELKRAQELAEVADANARGVAYLPVRAEILFERATVEAEAEAGSEIAEDLFEEAVVTSEAAREDELVARSSLGLMAVLLESPGAQRLPEVQRIGRRVAAKLNRVGGNPQLRGRLLELQGRAEVKSGEVQSGLGKLEESVRVLERAAGSKSTLLASPLAQLGEVYGGQGRHQEAAESLRRAHGVLVRAYGAEHAAAARLELQLARVLRQLRRPAEAEHHERHAKEVLQRAP